MSFVTSEYVLNSSKLPSDAQPLSFAVVSDLHNNCHGKRNILLLDQIDRIHPDVVLIAGDTIVGKPQAPMEHGLQFLLDIAKKYPVYAVNGNHEYRLCIYPDTYGSMYKRYEKVIEQAGIHLLRNESQVITVKGVSVRIYGYELPAEKYRRFHYETLSLSEMKKDIGECDKDMYSILLAHNPKYAKTYMQWGADLTLSGHYHGGIMRMPGGRGAVSPHGTILASFAHGHFEQNGSHTIVSAGLGSHTLPFRFCNPKELVSITVRSNNSHGNTRKTTGV